MKGEGKLLDNNTHVKNINNDSSSNNNDDTLIQYQVNN